jgi:hypothetical protein
MTTPTLLMIPKMIVALGESIGVVDTGICANVELEDGDSGNEAIRWLSSMIGGDGMASR